MQRGTLSSLLLLGSRSIIGPSTGERSHQGALPAEMNRHCHENAADCDRTNDETVTWGPGQVGKHTEGCEEASHLQQVDHFLALRRDPGFMPQVAACRRRRRCRCRGARTARWCDDAHAAAAAVRQRRQPCALPVPSDRPPSGQARRSECASMLASTVGDAGGGRLDRPAKGRCAGVARELVSCARIRCIRDWRAEAISCQ